MTEMTIRLYDVQEESGNFLDACRHISKMPLAARDILVGDYLTRMDKFLHRKEDGELYIMDFAQRRRVGDGRSSPTTMTEPFDLPQGQGFSPLTAVLYDDTSKKILIQFNNRGVRSSGIAEYVNRLSGGRFKFLMTITKDVEAKLDTKGGYMDTMSLRFRRGQVSPAHNKAGMLIDGAYDLMEKSGVEDVDELIITVKSKPGPNKKMKDKGVLKAFFRLHEAMPGVVLQSGTAKIASSPDDKAEFINLIGGQEAIKKGGLESGEKGTMYPLEGAAGRGQKMRDAHREWKERGIIYP